MEFYSVVFVLCQANFLHHIFKVVMEVMAFGSPHASKRVVRDMWRYSVCEHFLL